MTETISDTSQNNPGKYDPYPLDIRALIILFVTGLFTGLFGWLLYMGISEYFIEPVFCRSAETFNICSQGGTIAWVIAHIMVLAAAVAVLARIAVYRPLLVVLAVLASLWSAHAWLGGLDWYYGLAWHALLFGLSFMLFGWIARSTNFLVALIGSLVLAVAARLVLMSV